MLAIRTTLVWSRHLLEFCGALGDESGTLTSNTTHRLSSFTCTGVSARHILAGGVRRRLLWGPWMHHFHTCERSHNSAAVCVFIVWVQMASLIRNVREFQGHTLTLSQTHALGEWDSLGRIGTFKRGLQLQRTRNKKRRPIPAGRSEPAAADAVAAAAATLVLQRRKETIRRLL